MSTRCAIYSRKSSEEGLDQSFNSLHAQREACEAYVRSQISEGWVVDPRVYADGGFSGGSMERPGLRRLLADVAAGDIDVVAVYKVDRLTRSLIDFARLMETFEKNSVSFVSITQAFNTTSSMGKLTLNVLLSFAQFERDVTGERIRDKIAASKKKGLWMGGVPPLGYDPPKDRNSRVLALNLVEAETVKNIFLLFMKAGNLSGLQTALCEEGIRSKRWTTAGGRQCGGQLFSRGALRHLLGNRTYLGEVVHGEATYPGKHPPIVSNELFTSVQAIMEANSVRRRTYMPKGRAWLLSGRLFDTYGLEMEPHRTTGSKGKLYRYYSSKSLPGLVSDGDINHVPALDIEGLVVLKLSGWLG